MIRIIVPTKAFTNQQLLQRIKQSNVKVTSNLAPLRVQIRVTDEQWELVCVFRVDETEWFLMELIVCWKQVPNRRSRFSGATFRYNLARIIEIDEYKQSVSDIRIVMYEFNRFFVTVVENLYPIGIFSSPDKIRRDCKSSLRHLDVEICYFYVFSWNLAAPIIFHFRKYQPCWILFFFYSLLREGLSFWNKFSFKVGNVTDKLRTIF